MSQREAGTPQPLLTVEQIKEKYSALSTGKKAALLRKFRTVSGYKRRAFFAKIAGVNLRPYDIYFFTNHL